MKPNSLFKSTAIAIALLMCATATHAQKAKEKRVGSSVAVYAEPEVRVSIAPTATAAKTGARAKAVTTVRVMPTVTLTSLPWPLTNIKLSPKPRVKKTVRPEISSESETFVSEKTAAAAPNVIVTLSALSGSITVRGWDQQQVRVQTNDEKRIELQRRDGAKGDSPATRLQVLFYDSDEDRDESEGEECGGSTDIKMDVPRGANVVLKTQEGDIDVSDVAEVHAASSNGDISLRRVARAVEASSMSGDVTLRDAGGHVRLNSISGSIEAINVSASDAGDFIQAKTVSGDVTLEGIGPARVEAKTISGQLNMTGQLAPGGHYDFNTTSGDITLTLPENASFKVDAQVFTAGEISTNFPLKLAGKMPGSTPASSDHVVGTYGTGDASINLNSFSGTLRLRKK